MHLIETERLQIRRLYLSDLPELTSILSDPEVMKYSLHGVYDETATREFIEWCIDSYTTYGFGPWALVKKTTLELVGFCGIYPEVVGNLEEIGLGYRLGRNHWGKGFATEATTAVVDYAFTLEKVNSVVAIVEPEHITSIRVAEKAGFNSFNTIDFHNRLVRLYRLTQDQWLKVLNKPLDTGENKWQ